MRIVLIIILAVSFMPLKGQHNDHLEPCGTAPYKSEWLKEYQKHKADYPDKVEGEIFVPLNVTSVGHDEGFGRLTETDIIKAMCTLNEDFSGTDIQFYLEEMRTLFDTEFFEHSDILTGAQKMFEYDSETAVNCYLVGNPAGNCGYNLPYAGIALNTSCVTPLDHTWAHELGHAFSLPHPFLGWEGGVNYDGSTTHDFSDPAPEYVLYDYTLFQDTLILDTLIIDTAYVELMDGTNCEIAADGFCDTAPDYTSTRWACDSNMEGFTFQTDPAGVAFKPDGTLFMSYAFDACSNRFSGEQVLAMRASLEEEYTDIILAETPVTGEIVGNGGIELFAPYDVDLDFNDVEFKWTEVEHADYYLFQMGLGEDLMLIYFDTIIQDATLNMTEVNSTLPLRWQVTPFNKTDFCDLESSVTLDLELSDVSTISENELASTVRLIPNVLTDHNSFRVKSENISFVNYEIYSIAGDRIQTGLLTDEEILLGKKLGAGMYFVILKNGNQQVTLKFLQQ